MPAAKWFVRVGISAALLSGALAVPVSADPVTRAGDPDIVALQETAEEKLRAKARSARETYAAEIKAARTLRDSGLVEPKAQRAASLKQARTKAERRLARREYTRSAAPVIQEYRTARTALQAQRKAAIDEALAVYLVETGKPAVAEALKAYLAATAIAGDTLELALKSGRSTLKTDTADERAQLVQDLEETTTDAERNEAWLDFQAASAKDRKAYERSIASARATYDSAMAQARREFTLATDRSVKKLLRLPFKV